VDVARVLAVTDANAGAGIVFQVGKSVVFVAAALRVQTGRTNTSGPIPLPSQLAAHSHNSHQGSVNGLAAQSELGERLPRELI